MIRAICAAALVAAAAVSISAQSRQDASREGWCRNGDRENYCEVQEETLVGITSLDVDGSPNGGISVRGWDQPNARLRARIAASGDTLDDARELAANVRISSANGRIRADGPPNDRRAHWSVSFELDVPRNTRLKLAARNGGITIRDFDGYGRFATVNGGVTLTNVSGDLRGQTTNGGVRVQLSGRAWEGAGLDVSTQNGGVTLSIPDGYNAQLQASTVNGGLNIDFPVTLQTSGRTRQIDTTLGAGGATLRLSTVNGGLRVNRN